MDTNEFWNLIERAQSPQALHAELAGLPDDELAAFERMHSEAFTKSYDWGLWGAAYVIDGGCSDDTFDYFRAYLISRGRAAFENAMTDPDSLADVDIADGEEWEDWMSPTMMVIHARTGNYDFAAAPDPESQIGGQPPSGQAWEEDELPSRFPRLAAKYGWTS